MQTGVQLSKVKTDSLSPRPQGNVPLSSPPVGTILAPIPSAPAPNAGAGPSLVGREPEARQPEVELPDAPRPDAVAVLSISRRQLWIGASAVCAALLLLAAGCYV